MVESREIANWQVFSGMIKSISVPQSNFSQLSQFSKYQFQSRVLLPDTLADVQSAIHFVGV